MSDFIPQDDATRKAAPMFRGLLGYFPAALFEVAAHSLDSDRKHNGDNPDGPHWSRGKSTDHEDTIIRHLIGAGRRRPIMQVVKSMMGLAPKGSSAKDARRYHLRCLAWRALALLQEDCEADGATPGVSSVFPTKLDLQALRAERALHPAQKMAIEAFKRDYNGAETPEQRREAVNAFVKVRDAVKAGDSPTHPIQTTVFPPRDRFAALRPGDVLEAGPEDFGGDEER